MKTCKCGAVMDANAEVCPACGRRFTTPHTLIVGSLIFLAMLLFFGVLSGFLRLHH